MECVACGGQLVKPDERGSGGEGHRSDGEEEPPGVA